MKKLFLDRNSLLQVVDGKVSAKDMVKANPNWVIHIKPYLAALKPKSFSMSAIADQLETSQKLLVPNTNIETDNVAIWCMYKILSDNLMSDLLTSLHKPMTKHPTTSSAVPQGMRAYKEVWGIPYSRWVLDSPEVTDFFVGAGLHELQSQRELFSSVAESLDLAALREEWKVKNPGKETAYAARIAAGPFKGIFARMLLQVWVFHPSLRHPDMLLSLANFDEMPDPLEEPALLLNNRPNNEISDFIKFREKLGIEVPEVEVPIKVRVVEIPRVKTGLAKPDAIEPEDINWPD